MVCPKCKMDIPENSLFCLYCGKKLHPNNKPAHKPKQRGNGQGCVYKLPNGKYRAVVTLAYKTVDGKTKRIEKTRSDFVRKKDALDYLPQLRRQAKPVDTSITFKALYDLWIPTHEACKSTIGGYKAACNYYEPLFYIRFSDLGIDDFQECVDDCPRGKRTRHNMKVLITLLYKYAIPRGYAPEKVNYGEYLKEGSGSEGIREAFTKEEIERIHSAYLQGVPWADYVYAMIYTGFRPHEFLTLDIRKYNREERAFVGGGKTKAGTNRLVTVSPKIQPIVDRLIAERISGPIFCDLNGKEIPLRKFREEYFASALKAAGITRKLTPYCCRHTFATLMKNIIADDRDKLELMGHTSTEMLRHYQHINYEDLRKITDKI